MIEFSGLTAGWGTRRCVVMVTDEPTLQQRTQKREREEGKMVPVAAVMDMKVRPKVDPA